MTRYTCVFEWPDDKAPPICGSEKFLGGTLCSVQFNDALASTECTWTEDDNGAWHSECGHLFETTDGGPAENNMRHCCFCGRALIGRRRNMTETSSCMKIYYMRDNHAFVHIPLDVSLAESILRQEFSDGWTYGMMCSHSEGMKDLLHASGGENAEQFFNDAKDWVSKAIKIANGENA